jgi:hypothetical protein
VERCTADPGSFRTQKGPGSAAHHFMLRCDRETVNVHTVS